MKSWAWAAFWTVGIIWGSSFLLIRVGVESLSPAQLVLIRTGIAALGLNAVMLLRGRRWPRDGATLRALVVIGVGNTVLPYFLISVGEQTVPSGLASVIQATVPFFSLAMAHFAFTDERISTRKVAGIVFGFTGIIVLSSRSLTDGRSIEDLFLGQMAIIAASFCYASATVYSRSVLKTRVEPIVVATTVMTFGALVSPLFVLLEPALGGRAWVPLGDVGSDALLVAFALGFFNTFIAYLFFYFIVQELGAFRATMVTYIVPVVGLLLGWLVLDEVIDSLLLLGAALIFTGIAIINLRLKHLRFTRQAAATVD